MDFKFNAEQEKLRQEVREFIEDELAKGNFETHCDAWMGGYSAEFSRKMGEKGWIGVCWPKDCYGQGKGYVDRMVITEELVRYGAPAAAHWFADRQMGPSIIRHGTKEQQDFFLPRIAKGEFVFGIGMSEPEAGCDLASLKTKAVPDGDDYVINGQKVWTSGAQHIDYIYLIARTDTEVPKHKGISEFIIDMKTPGIDVRPLIDMTGGHHYNEVFFDNVRIPKTTLVGELNKGWYQIAQQLDFERSGVERLMTNYPLLEDIIKYVKETQQHGQPMSKQINVRQSIADLIITFEAGRLLTYRVAWVLDQGKLPTTEAALAKAFSTAFEQQLAQVTSQIPGLYGTLRQGSKGIPPSFREPPAESYLFSPAYTIQGGTNEILRNIIAGRGLGLPSK
ncbi:MAG: acyl-CoA dehydrogenase family protein [Chloroflexota bacterium]|nr:acyl-CoA dehydrogenase family protein [Chloroflexota bacterium]